MVKFCVGFVSLHPLFEELVRSMDQHGCVLSGDGGGCTVAQVCSNSSFFLQLALLVCGGWLRLAVLRSVFVCALERCIFEEL